MANKSIRYIITWTWREQGNRTITDHWQGTATSVPRAISKMVKELNAGLDDGEEPIRAADLFVLDVRSTMFDRKVQEWRETTA